MLPPTPRSTRPDTLSPHTTRFRSPSNVTPLGRDRMRIDWNLYDPGSHFDELLAAAGQPRPTARGLTHYLRSLSDTDLAARKAAAELAIVEMGIRSEEHTSELQTLMRIEYAVFCLKKKK